MKRLMILFLAVLFVSCENDEFNFDEEISVPVSVEDEECGDLGDVTEALHDRWGGVNGHGTIFRVNPDSAFGERGATRRANPIFQIRHLRSAI